MTSIKRTCVGATACLLFAITSAATAQTTTMSDAWTWRATLYGWLPSVHSTSDLDIGGGESINTDTNPSSYLSNLKFTVMGTLEARKGAWSFIGDAIYLNFGNLKSNLRSIEGPGGIIVIPATANIRTDLKGFAGALEGGYSLMQTPTANVDLVAGARYLRIKTRLEWELTGPLGGVPAQGNAEVTKDIWDGVVGLRGRTDLADSWYLPYYVDIGGGTSNFTWQAFSGIGYRFAWGDVTLGYRHLAYNFHGDQPLDKLAFSGPIFGVGFKF
jgi:hypothetical protein